MAFFIKQHDLLPNLPFQILTPSMDPKDLSDVTSIDFIMRKKGTTVVLIKQPCVITDSPNGIGHYDWSEGDTDDAGTMEYEFELTFNSGDTQSVPVDKNLELTIVPDIG